MRVIDTSLWVELIGHGTLMEQARTAIEPINSCIVPAMVHYELAKFCGRTLLEAQTASIMSLLTECVSAEMDSGIATEAAALSLKYKLHATDAIIYATAQMHDARLYTSDAHFKDLPGVEYFEKAV